MIYYLQFETNTCVDVCPDGQYENATAHKCLPCDSTCATCDMISSNCTSCYMTAGAFVFLDGNRCVQNCPDGEYEDSSLYHCLSCADGCTTCTGPSLLECQTCGNSSITNYYKVVGNT